MSTIYTILYNYLIFLLLIILGDSSQTQDMELCSGDSTPTSEKSFQLSNVPTQRHNSSTPQSQVLLYLNIKIK